MVKYKIGWKDLSKGVKFTNKNHVNQIHEISMKKVKKKFKNLNKLLTVYLTNRKLKSI